MSLGLPKPVVVCPECGERNPATAQQCWMCEDPLPRGPGVPATGTAALPELQAKSSTFWLSWVLVVVALGAVLTGVGTEAPGLAILLVILVVGPVFLILSVDRTAAPPKARPTTLAAETGPPPKAPDAEVRLPVLPTTRVEKPGPLLEVAGAEDWPPYRAPRQTDVAGSCLGALGIALLSVLATVGILAIIVCVAIASFVTSIMNTCGC